MKAFPFDSHVTYDAEGAPIFDRAIDSKTYRYIFRELFKSGIMPNPSSNMQVTTGEGMNVIVLPGFAMVDGCMALEEENRTLAVQSSDSQYDRIDTVVLRLNANDGYRLCDYYIVEGLPSSNPIRPDLTREGDIYEIGLADLYITKNSSVISGSKITDTRYENERCGVISSISEFDTETLNAQMNAWSAEQRAAFMSWMNTQETDFANWRSLQQSEFAEWMLGEKTDFESWSEIQRAAFTTWFETIKNILDESTAGHLQNQIDEIKQEPIAGIGAYIRISTNTASFEGLTITATSEHETLTTTFAAGQAKLTAHYLGEYTLSVTNVDGRTYTDIANVTALGAVIDVQMDEHYSTVTITTESAELASMPVLVTKDGALVDTVSFIGNAAVFKTYETGTYTITINYADETYKKTFVISAMDQRETWELIRQYATISITTESAELANADIVITKDGATVKTIAFVNSSATYKATELGTYTFTCTYDGDEYSEEVNATEYTGYVLTIDTLKIVTWADGTWEEIRKMLDAHYKGRINIGDYWSVGDKREGVSLSAMSAVSPLTDTHSAQTIGLTIVGIEHDDLATPINGKTKAAITVSQTDCLNNKGMMNPNHNSYTYARWSTSPRRTWMSTYKNALPSAVRSLIKTVSKKSAYPTNSSNTQSTETTSEICFLFSNYELFGTTYSSYVTKVDGVQYEYFKTQSNRVKKVNGSAHYWWSRSGFWRSSSSNANFVDCYSDGSQGYHGANSSIGLAPGFCL